MTKSNIHNENFLIKPHPKLLKRSLKTVLMFPKTRGKITKNTLEKIESMKKRKLFKERWCNFYFIQTTTKID